MTSASAMALASRAKRLPSHSSNLPPSLAGVQMDGLPDDLARRVFGLWSNACAQLVQQRSWHEPYRYAPTTSRGVVFARPAPQGPCEVISALGLPDWQPGQTFKALPRGARELLAR